MLGKLYQVLDRSTRTQFVEPTFNRDSARAQKVLLKQQGLDPVIVASKLQVVQQNIIR